MAKAKKQEPGGQPPAASEKAAPKQAEAKSKQPAPKPAASTAGAAKPPTAAKAPATAAKAPAAAARAPATKPASKKAAAMKGGKSQFTPGAPSVPLIDTSLAAQAAAKMVATLGSAVAGGPAVQPAAEGGAKRETSTFKQLKESLNKPAAGGLGNLLTNAPDLKKPGLPFGPRKQVGRNQTFGADVNRSGVPRRTGG